MQVSGCKIEKSELLRYLGYAGQKIDCAMSARIEALAERCMTLSKPACVWRTFPVAETNGGVSVSGGAAVFRGNDIAEHLRGAFSCAVMAVTLGMDTEKEMRALESRSVTDAIVFSAACTVLVESAADLCEEEIRSEAAKSGCYVNFRYSPGYGDFPLDTQKTLLKLIDAERQLGIRLTDGMLMLPRKSVSAVLGIFHHQPEEWGSGCARCSMRETCVMRKRGKSCGR